MAKRISKIQVKNYQDSIILKNFLKTSNWHILLDLSVLDMYKQYSPHLLEISEFKIGFLNFSKCIFN